MENREPTRGFPSGNFAGASTEQGVPGGFSARQIMPRKPWLRARNVFATHF